MVIHLPRFLQSPKLNLTYLLLSLSLSTESSLSHLPTISKAMMRRNQQDQQSRIFYELSSLVLNLLRSPAVALTDQSASSSNGRIRASRNEITPAGFASLMLGISLALMLCGSVTFFIGFLLMPWVLGLIMVFYVVGIVSTISMLGRWLFSYALAPPRKDIPAWKLL